MNNNGIAVAASGSASGLPARQVEVHRTVRFSQFPDDNAVG
jgi:hypothetical protein